MNTKNNKRIRNFNLVQFGDGSNDIVPREWLLNTELCKWPPQELTNDGKNNIENLARKRVTPDSYWSTCICKISCSAST